MNRDEVLLAQMRDAVAKVERFTAGMDEAAFRADEKTQSGVCWSQQQGRNELITVGTLCRVIGLLHAHRFTGLTASSFDDLVPALDKAIGDVGVNVMRENVRTFFGLIDECWGIQRVHYKGMATYLKHNFLAALAKLLSDFEEFWRGPDEKRLFIDAPLRRKIGSFKIDDPEVQRMAGASGLAREHLFILMVSHVQKGRRTPLKNRYGANDVVDFGGDGQGGDGAEAEEAEAELASVK